MDAETAVVKKRAAIMPGGLGAGVGAAIAMMLVMALLRFTSNTISLPELMEDSLTHLAGGQVESYFINNLGVGGKALLLVSVVEGTLLLGAILGVLFTRFWPVRRAAQGWRWFSGLLYGLIVGAFLNLVFLPLVGQGFFGANSIEAQAPPGVARALYGTELAPFGIPVALSMFILSIAFGLALVALLPWHQFVGASTAEGAAPAVASEGGGRRDFVRAMGGGAAAVVGGAALWYVIREALAPPSVAGPQLVESEPGGGSKVVQPGPTTVAQQPLTQSTPGVAQPTSVAAQTTPGATHQPGPEPTPKMTEVVPTPPVPAGFEGVKPLLVPEITPTESFYVTTKNFIDPTVDGASWRLSFKGLVGKPYSITLEELRAMPSVEVVHTLACISNPVGGTLIGNGRWKGVRFADLVKRAEPKEGVLDLVTRAADGYADSFALDVALRDDCILAYEMNGAPLNQKHGFPARLLVPSIFGMKNTKWITEVALVDTDFKGYWQSRGWSDPAPYLTMSRIDYPDKGSIPAKPIYVGGVAYAGDRGVKRVEVSADGGKTWGDAALRDPSGNHTWVLWTFPWNPQPGSYTVQVRATDGKDEVQTSKVQDTFPDGATGYHTRQVRVS